MGKFEIDPNLKAEINKEGWEKESEESGAAVLIGKKEEMAKLKEILENEGRTKDLGSYIRLHKEILLPNNEIQENPNLQNRIQAQIGRYDLALWNDKTGVLRYVDKDGNYTRVPIEFLDIAAFKKWEGYPQEILNELKNLGFKERFSRLKDDDLTFLKDVEIAIGNYKKKLEEQMQTKESERFNF